MQLKLAEYIWLTGPGKLFPFNKRSSYQKKNNKGWKTYWLKKKKKKLVILILCLIWTKKKMLNLNYLNRKLKAFDEQQKPFLPTLKNLFNLKQLWVVYYVEFRKAARKIIRLDGIFTKSVSKDGCQHLRVKI